MISNGRYASDGRCPEWPKLVLCRDALSPRSPKSTANLEAQAFPESRGVMAHAVFQSLLTCALVVGAHCRADVRLVDAFGTSSNSGLLQVRFFRAGCECRD